MSAPTPESIKQALCDLTVVERAHLGFEIALAQVYANGDVVTVFVEPHGNGFNVHDGGNASMLLENSGVSLTSAVTAQLERAVKSYGCEFAQDRVFGTCGGSDEIAMCAALVGCASRVVADYRQQADAVPRFDFRQQLVEALHEVVGTRRIRENDEVMANTGTRYLISATVLDERASKPVAFVEAVSGRQSVTRKFRALYDLKNTPLLGETKRVAVYDDLRPGITSGDISLLRDVCVPIAFSERNARPEYRGLLN